MWTTILQRRPCFTQISPRAESPRQGLNPGRETVEHGSIDVRKVCEPFTNRMRERERKRKMDTDDCENKLETVFLLYYTERSSSWIDRPSPPPSPFSHSVTQPSKMIIVRFTSSPPSLEFFLYYSQIFKIIIPNSVSTEYLLRQRLFRQHQYIASKKL